MILPCDTEREKSIYDKFKKVEPVLHGFGKHYVITSRKDPLVSAYAREDKNSLELEINIAIKPDRSINRKIDLFSTDLLDVSDFRETLLPTETEEEKNLVVDVFEQLLNEKLDELIEKEKNATLTAKNYLKR